MKRVLSIAVACLAVVCVSALATAQAATLVKPKVTVKSTPTKDLKRPHVFKVKGSVIPASRPVKCAAGTTNPAYCSPAPTVEVCKGKMRITIKRGLTTIARKTINLRSSCTYNVKITVRKKMKHGKLNVVSRFMGNGYVSARNSSALRLKV